MLGSRSNGGASQPPDTSGFESLVAAWSLVAVVSVAGCYLSHEVAPAASPDAGLPLDRDAGAQADADTIGLDAGQPVDGGGDGGVASRAFCDPSVTSVASASIYADSSRVVLVVVDEAREGHFYELVGAAFQPRELRPSIVGNVKLSSTLGAPLFEYGADGCGIRVIDGDVRTCSGAVAVRDLVVRSTGEAFALGIREQYWLNGGLWRQFGPAFAGATPLQSIWFDGANLWTVGIDGVYGSSVPFVAPRDFDATSPHLLPLAVWARDETNVWMSSKSALFQRTGGEWIRRAQSVCPEDVSAGLGRAEDEAVFFTEHMLRSIPASGAPTTLALPCAASRKIVDVERLEAGVWLVVSLDAAPRDACGEVVIETFEGGRLRPF